jgi:hypothetical protein
MCAKKQVRWLQRVGLGAAVVAVAVGAAWMYEGRLGGSEMNGGRGGPTVLSPSPGERITSIPSAPMLNPAAMEVGQPQDGVVLRKFPYPYQAMLAISPDADHETLRKFNLVHEFLNTHARTPWGPGLGLDVADSFFMYNGSNVPTQTDVGKPLSDELSYFKGTSDVRYGADVIDRYIHVGWIDTLHTFGDFTMTDSRQTKFTRALAERAIAALRAHGDEITVWTDHGNQSNVDNFGRYGVSKFDSYQQGANPWSEYYHTDLTIPYGVRFVWPDNTDDVFAHSSMIYPIRLPDGRDVWGFWRYTNTGYTKKGAPLWCWSVNDPNKALTPSHLDQLVLKHDYSVIVTHFFANNTPLPLPASAVDALRLLARYDDDGQVLVARTSRLLQYNVTEQYLRWHVTRAGRETVIHLDAIADPLFGTHRPSLDEVRGITFYVQDPAHIVIDIGNTPVPASLLQRNPSDGVAPSIGIRWWPADTTNYAVNAPGIA